MRVHFPTRTLAFGCLPRFLQPRCLVNRFSHLAGDFGKGQALASDLRENRIEAVRVTHILPVVVPEGLLIEVTEEMERLNTYVGTTDAALQQRPEVLKAVGVDATVDVLDSMIHNLMRVVGSKALIAEKEVS